MPETVSVIMPTFNRAALMPSAVRSVIAQTWRPIELVVVNDGSSDSTQAVLDGLRAEVIASGVKPVFISQANAGVAAARNAAIAAATGQWLAFLDDDDSWDARKLSLQMEQLARSAADVCCCQVFQPDSRGGRRVPMQAAQLLQGRCASEFLSRTRNAHICSIVVRRALVQPFDASLRVAEDLLWVYGILLRARCCAVAECLVTMGDQPGSLMRTAGLQRLVELDAFVERWLLKARELGAETDQWDEQAWQTRVAVDFSQMVKHRLYIGDVCGAREVYERGIQLCGGKNELRKVRSKIRKARLIGLLGLRIKHPKRT